MSFVAHVWIECVKPCLSAILLCYIAPAALADARRHRWCRSIMVINILLGWTVVGWLLVLYWSLSNNVRPERLEWTE
jgi:hypothetical protein